MQGQNEPRPSKSMMNAAVSMMGLSSQQIASFVITLLAAGFLTPAEYGVYTLAIVFVEFVVTMTYTGYYHFVVNSDEDDSTVLSTMFVMMVGIGLLGGATLFFGAEMIAAFFNAPELAPVLRWFGLMQPFASAIGWASAALTRARLMRRYFLILAASNLGGMAAGCVILVLWQSLYALVAYRAIRILLGLVLFGAAIPQWPSFRFDPSMARRATGFASGLYGSRFLNFFSRFGTDLVLAYLFTTAESGLYRFANRLATATIDIVGQPLRSYALNRFGHASREGLPLDGLFAQFLAALVFLLGGFAISVMVLGGPLIRQFFLPEYLAALGALYALAVRGAAMAGTNLIEPVFAARKKTKVGMYHDLFWTFVMVGVILLVSPFGFEWLAAAQAITTIMTSIGALFVIRKWGGIPLRAAVGRSLRALTVLAAYGAALQFGWMGIEQSIADGRLALFAGIGLAFVFAVPTVFVAIKLRVLSISVFAD